MRRWTVKLAVALAIASLVALCLAILSGPPEELEYDAVGEDAAHASAEVAAVLIELNRFVTETVRTFPEQPIALDLMAELHLRFGKAEHAEAWWTKCLELDPQYLPAHQALATVATNRGEHAAAAAHYRRAMALDPASSVYPVQLAESLMQTGELEEAIQILEQDLGHHPASMPCNAMLGLAYVQAQRDEEGRRCLERTIAMAPDYTNAYFALAKACGRLGDREQSGRYMAEFQRLKQEDEQRHRESLKSSDDVQAVRATAAQYYSNGAKIYIGNGDVAEGERLLLMAEELSPDAVDAKLILAWLYQRQGKREEAVGRLRDAAASAADDVDALMRLAESYVELEAYQAAEAVYERVMELRAQQPAGYAALAGLYLRWGNKLAEARQCATRATELEPLAKNFLLLAMVCQREGDLEAARDALDRAIVLAPGDLQLQHFRQQLGDHTDGSAEP